MTAGKGTPADRQAGKGGTKPEQGSSAGSSETQKGQVDEASDESFPASDPPSFTPTHAGTPDDPEEE